MIQVFYFTQINILGKLAVNGSPVVGPKKHHSPDRETKEAGVPANGMRGSSLRYEGQAGTSAALRQVFYFDQINKTPFAAKGITVF